MKAHIHRAKPRMSIVRGFRSCCTPGKCDGASHGGVEVSEICACGAVRITNRNDKFTCSTRWEGGDLITRARARSERTERAGPATAPDGDDE